MYNNVIGFGEMARPAACLASKPQASTARQGRCPNRLRTLQSARGDLEVGGAAELRGGLVLAASLIGSNHGRSNGSDCRRNIEGGPGVSRLISRAAK